MWPNLSKIGEMMRWIYAELSKLGSSGLRKAATLLCRSMAMVHRYTLGSVQFSLLTICEMEDCRLNSGHERYGRYECGPASPANGHCHKPNFPVDILDGLISDHAGCVIMGRFDPTEEAGRIPLGRYVKEHISNSFCVVLMRFNFQMRQMWRPVQAIGVVEIWSFLLNWMYRLALDRRRRGYYGVRVCIRGESAAFSCRGQPVCQRIKLGINGSRQTFTLLSLLLALFHSFVPYRNYCVGGDTFSFLNFFFFFFFLIPNSV